MENIVILENPIFDSFVKKEIDSIEMKPLKIGDLYGIDQDSKDARTVVKMISKACAVSEKDLANLTLRDFKKCARILENFSKESPEATES